MSAGKQRQSTLYASKSTAAMHHYTIKLFIVALLTCYGRRFGSSKGDAHAPCILAALKAEQPFPRQWAVGVIDTESRLHSADKLLLHFGC